MRRSGLIVALVTLPFLHAFPVIAGERGEVWKNPNCGCCKAWLGHMQSNGFEFTVREATSRELDAVRTESGMPAKFAGCHTAKIGGYIIEGHVPAADVARLLADMPDAIGLSVPGMPAGSPGMETDGTVDAFDVLLIKKNGANEVFASYPAKAN